MLTLSRLNADESLGCFVAEQRREIIRQLAVFSNAGMTFVFSVLIGFGIGWALDNKLFAGKTAPWFTFIFFALGIIAGFRSLWALTKMVRDE